MKTEQIQNMTVTGHIPDRDPDLQRRNPDPHGKNLHVGDPGPDLHVGDPGPDPHVDPGDPDQGLDPDPHVGDPEDPDQGLDPDLHVDPGDPDQGLDPNPDAGIDLEVDPEIDLLDTEEILEDLNPEKGTHIDQIDTDQTEIVQIDTDRTEIDITNGPDILAVDLEVDLTAEIGQTPDLTLNRLPKT